MPKLGISFQIWFSPIFGGKNGVAPSMRLRYRTLSFPAWVQKHFQGGARGSPGTGLHHSWQPCFHQHFVTLEQKPAVTFVCYNNMHRRNKMIRNNLTGLMITRQHTFKNNHWERNALNFVRQFSKRDPRDNVSSKWISSFTRNCGLHRWKSETTIWLYRTSW